MTAPKLGRPAGTLTALTALQEARLITELRIGAGPVNLSATARAYGISRSTLLRCIDREPGLRQVIEERRKTDGRGYVQVKRGTRATRAAAKLRAAEPRPAKADRPMNPKIAAQLQAWLDKLDSWQQFLWEGSRVPGRYAPPTAPMRIASNVDSRPWLKFFSEEARAKMARKKMRWFPPHWFPDE